MNNCMEKLAALWERKAPASKKFYARALRRIPSGVCHDMRHRLPFPPYYVSASGSRKLDVDGNGYLDLWMGHGSLLLGHAPRAVADAIADQAYKGTHLGGSNPYEVELAELIGELVPTAERVRFTMSGTESTMLAIRVARAATGKPGIIKFAEHFHGWHDVGSVGRQPPFDKPLGGGLPDGVTGDVHVCAQGDVAGLERLLSGRNDIAAAILEPTGAHGGQGPLDPAFVRRLRAETEKRGVLLILDEVVTGFRVAPGGAQELLGVQADLVAFAKVLFGGLPGGAVAGRAQHMDFLSFSTDLERNRYKKVHHNGTHNSNPMASRVGLAVLQTIRGGSPNAQAARAADAFIAAGNRVFKEEGLSWRFYGGNSILHLSCALDDKTAAACERDGYDKFAAQLLAAQPPARKLLDLALLINGVDLPTGGQAWASSAHTDEDAAFFAGALKKSVAMLREYGGIA